MSYSAHIILTFFGRTVMFDDVNNLKYALQRLSSQEFVENHILSGEAKYFSERQISSFCRLFSEYFDYELIKDRVYVVGSSKIGYALHPKTQKEVFLDRFRPFRAESDIDITICDQKLFQIIWFEINRYACTQSKMPWISDLSPYLLYGWLRPDKFPKGCALAYCDRFYSTIGAIRRNRNQGHPKISVGIFYSIEQLRYYQYRSVKKCQQSIGEIA